MKEEKKPSLFTPSLSMPGLTLFLSLSLSLLCVLVFTMDPSLARKKKNQKRSTASWNRPLLDSKFLDLNLAKKEIMLFLTDYFDASYGEIKKSPFSLVRSPFALCPFKDAPPNCEVLTLRFRVQQKKPLSRVLSFRCEVYSYPFSETLSPELTSQYEFWLGLHCKDKSNNVELAFKRNTLRVNVPKKGEK